jgi:chloramphenicol 3-O-phosphotransferase
MLCAVPGAVWLITGAQASGKSTVADLLARQFERGVHVRGGQFYRWAVRGWVHFDDADRPDEARRLLGLRYRLSAIVAEEYAAAGFTTVVQDNIYGADVTDWLGSIAARPRHLVVLRPSVAVVSERHEDRRRTSAKVAYRDGYTAADNDAHLMTTPRDRGLWLDTSAQTPDESVREIVARAGEAVIL